MLSEIESRLSAEHLAIVGGFAAEPEEPGLPRGTRTLLLIGPGAGFWSHFTASRQWQDGRPDPMDRWSRRVIGRIACGLSAKALFPFGGPPYRPFFQWALRSGRIWQSPVRLLVHDRQGLWISFRGALALREPIPLPPPPPEPPCATCEGQPCLSACPPAALTAAGYDLPVCHGFLDTPAGETCLTGGCAVRRACPVSQGYDRMAGQSAYHMARFHPGRDA